MDEELKNVATLLYKIDCLLFGKFKLSSEVVVNSYFDLTSIISFPDVLDKTCRAACNFLKKKNLVTQNICGVSYSGIPFAVLVSNKLRIPLLMRNKEISLCLKNNRIEGKIVENSEVMIIEEVMCSGTSTLQVIKDLEDAGMKVKHIFVIVDLEQGGFENLRKLGYESYSLFKMSQFSNILYKAGFINEDQLEDVRQGWSDYFVLNGDVTNSVLAKRLSIKYEGRMANMKSKIAKRLFQIMFKKKSNICVDLSSCDFKDIIQTADLIGPYISILCLHLNVYDELNVNQIRELKRIALKHNFLLMDDSKLSEENSVLRHQLKKILNVVDIVSVLPLTGESCIKEINSVTDEMPDKGIFLIASLLTEDMLCTSSFEKDVIKLGLSHCKSLIGFVSHKNSTIPLGYIHMMSDMRSTGSVTGNITNLYYSSKQMTETLGADIVVVFLPENCDALELIKQQKYLSWHGYENRFCAKKGFCFDDQKSDGNYNSNIF